MVQTTEIDEYENELPKNEKSFDLTKYIKD